MGLRSWTRWKAALANRGLQPLPITPQTDAKQCQGVGGASTIVEIAEVPVGLGGFPGIMTFTVLDDSNGQEVPPLVPINLLEGLDAVLAIRDGTMDLRAIGVVVQCAKEMTGHHSASLMDFPESGWCLPTYMLDKYGGRDPFRMTSSTFAATVSETQGIKDETKDEEEDQARSGTERDTWERTDQGWRRNHVRLRRQLFSPMSTSAGPRPSELKEHRVTEIMYADGTKERLEDRWTDPALSERLMARPWRGATVFLRDGHPEDACVSVRQ